jgi:NADPH-dependent curcumin reductase CurA
VTNRRVVLRAHPPHIPTPDDFDIVETDVPEPGDGEMLVRNLYFSVEPAIRARLDGKETYMPPIGLGEPIQSPTVGRVVRSNHPEYREGDILFGFNNWDDYVVVSDQTLLLERLQPEEGVPLSYYVGALGGSGTTAYVGLHTIGGIQAGETVAISAAAGGVGSVAGQIARLRGCRVVGLVGSPDKAELITERLGFHAAINYREADDLADALAEACPDGVDLYYDNVGGTTLDAMLLNMKTMGRVVACGMMAGYNQQDRPPAVYNLWEVVARQLRMQGFLLPFYPEGIQEALVELHKWVRSGELVVLENVTRGIHRAPETFCRLMAGTTVGKTLVEVQTPEGSRPPMATLAEQLA